MIDAKRELVIDDIVDASSNDIRYLRSFIEMVVADYTEDTVNNHIKDQWRDCPDDCIPDIAKDLLDKEP